MSPYDEEEPPFHKLLKENPNVELEEVQALIDKYPNAAKEKDEYGALPLFYAAYYGSSVEVVQLLIDEYPGAVREKDKNGDLPLHHAAEQGASVEVIQLLIKEYPDAVKEKHNDGDLPLHLAARSDDASEEVIQLLTNEYPDALKEKDKKGNLPLPLTLRETKGTKERVDNVNSTQDKQESSVDESDNALHKLLKENPNVELDEVQALIDKYPNAAKKKDEYGALPLFYAAYYGASVEVMQLLIDEYPGAVREKDNNGGLPLHHAAEQGASVEVIQLLINEYPDALKEKDNDGDLPLHLAARSDDASEEVIQLLTNEYPDALKEKDKKGNLPLPLTLRETKGTKERVDSVNSTQDKQESSVDESDNALHKLLDEKKENVELEEVQALIDKYPDAAKKKDEYGTLPLFYAAYYGASVEVMQLLIDEYPDAMRKKDNFGSLPLHHAVENGAPMEVIQLLIKEYPDVLKEKDENGNLPLHYAAAKVSSVEVIEQLINEYPDALRKKGLNGYLPLHRAVRNGASVEVTTLLFNEYPDALKEKNENGDLPLHIAIEEGVSVEVIQLLFKEYPDALKEKGEYGNLPLHYVVEKVAAVEVIEQLIKEYPDAVRKKDNNGYLPLHIAVRKGVSVKVVQLLINEYPDAAKEEDENGTLPLLYAVENVAFVEVIEQLINEYPDALRKKGLNGYLPLHYAVENGASVEVTKLLLNEYPDALKEKNENGDLPLHIAIEEGVSVEVMQLLIQEYPDALKEKGEYGNLPLHYVVEKVAPVEVIEQLIKEYPDAVRKKDNNRDLPLHIAVRKGVSVKVVQLLINEYPDAAKEKDKNEDLPLHIVVRKDASVEMIQLLIQEYHDALKEKNGFGHLPLHTAIVCRASVEVMQLLIKEYPDALKEKDKNGNLPLHIAIQEGVSDEVIQLLIKEYPDALKERNDYRDLPLHRAIGTDASVEVIQLLIKEYPDALKETNDYGDLPLHRAVRKGVSDEVIKLLINEYPDALKEKDKNEDLPLHIAVRKDASVEMIQLLIQEYHDALKEKNRLGHLPLSWALSQGDASAEVIQLLIKENPDALKETNKHGSLPLHRAVSQGASVEVIQLLIKEYSDALRKKGLNGYLPLHWAIEKVTSVEVVQLLIKEYPDALKEKNEYIDEELPLHFAIKKGASNESIELIRKAHPQAAKEKIRDGRLPIEACFENENAGDLVLALLKDDMPVSIEHGLPVEHSGSWTTCVSSSTATATAAVRQILLSDDKGGAGFGKYIHALADVRDAEGRTALGAASAEARTEIYEYHLFCSRYKLHPGPPEHITGTSALFRADDLDDAAQVDYRAKFDNADIDGDGKLNREELEKIAVDVDIGLTPDLFLKDSSDKKSISEAEFVAICKRLLGDGPPEVAIKLMQSKDHWERERNARKDRDLDPKYVVSELMNVPSPITIEKAVEKGGGGLKSIVENFLGGIYPGKYAFFMKAGDRNLQQIFYQEQPKLEVVRGMLKQVFEAVEHLHEKKLMHGDIKMLNILRFRIDNRLRLIDLDASARLEQMGVEDEKKTFTGVKFSSAILPPEMIERIETEELEAFKKYWGAEKDEDLDEKVKPKPYKERGAVKAHYVVKSFRTKDGQPVHNGLPYDLVRASESIDAWSLGVLAFTLLTGETLVPSTREDNCATGAAMHVLYSWGTRPELLNEVFKKIHNDAARDLVRQLLEYESGNRPSIASLLKDHPFFNPTNGVVSDSIEKIKTSLEDAAKDRKDDRALLEKLDANIFVIKQLSVESKSEIRRTRHVLMKGIYEATEIDAPTTFTVLNEKLPSAASIEKAKKQILDLIPKEDGSGVDLKTKYASLTFSAEGADVALKGKLKEHCEKVETGMKWAKRIKELGSKVAAGEVGKAFDTIKEGIKDLIVGDEMYLYLIDELTGAPVQAEGWPLPITKPSEVVPKLLPLMQLGLRGISVMNGVAGVAIFFGGLVPKIPQDVIKGAQESVELLKKESSVEEFGVVHEEVKGGTEEQKSVRGASLREFKEFLEKNDPGLKEGKKNGDFAGLQRIGDPEDGGALWTLLTDPKDIENALLERAKLAKQRKLDLEQLKHNEYIKQKAREREQSEEEQMKHNKHIKETTKKEIQSEGEEGIEVISGSGGKVTTEKEKNKSIDSSSRMHTVEYSEEIAKLIEDTATAAAKEAVTAAAKEVSKSTKDVASAAAEEVAKTISANACCCCAVM